MTENKEIKEYALGTGTLYVAGGRVSEALLESDTYKTGETKGSCILKYECDTKELFDIEGNIVTVLRFGEKVRVRGSVGRIFPDALSSVLSGDRGMGGRGTVSVLLVCPLPNGEAFRLYLCGAVRTVATFNVSAGGGFDFDLVYGGDVSNPRFCMMREGGVV